MKPWLRVLGMAACMFINTVQADADCEDPVASWQPRDTLREQLESRGWTIKRIRVDNGCYEVHGTDHNGNWVEAEFAPASLEIMKLEIRFRHHRGQKSDIPDYDESPAAPRTGQRQHPNTSKSGQE